MKRFPSNCPVCDESMRVKTLQCPSCDTEVNGDFGIQPLLSLSGDDADFLMLFLKARGNLSEMAKILGISYPTVRVRFEEFLKKVGIEPSQNRDNVNEVLDLLEQGDISASEAVNRVKKSRE
jgi:hypothetical protein